MKSYRNVTIASLVFAILCFGNGGTFAVPFVNLGPGPMYNTIGSYDGVDLIQISGRETFPTSGQLDLTTVNERGGPYGGLTLPEALIGWIDPDVVVVPTTYLFKPGVSKNEVETENQLEFSGSQTASVAAALNYLKIPYAQQTVVSSIVKNSPASGKLEVGDVIRAIDGTAVKSPQDVPPLVRKHPPGSTVVFAITRASKKLKVPVVLGASPTNPQQSFAGITAGVKIQPPFEIKFGLNDVGGPSAGTMFALGIIDKLTPDNVNGGKVVAGTGTIAPDGTIGPIGGISQKLAAARDHHTELFLAPKANCADIRNGGDKGVNVAAVENLTQAMDVLAKWKADQSAQLPRCS